ncbi:MAG: biopolymer transporter ExbD [Planctomycetes bacterium]|nr:biopolymer transporter ExbD [Planctomycetota bacterium]
MKRQRRNAEGATFDMTPMIDCVFQLLIFFIVCTQITQQENVQLRLPDALAANEDPKGKGAGKTFTIHIAALDQNPASIETIPEAWGWFCYGEPVAKSAQEMTGILQQEAKAQDPGNDNKPGWDAANNRSENMVLIRMDARAPAGEFGKLIELMAREARIYKIKVAVLQDIKVD